MARKLKVHPIEIREAGDYGCPPDGLWSKGRHESKAFIEAANEWLATQSVARKHAWLGVHKLETEYESKVVFEWLRFIPNYLDEGVGAYLEAKPHTRGAFPATTVWF